MYNVAVGYNAGKAITDAGTYNTALAWMHKQ